MVMPLLRTSKLRMGLRTCNISQRISSRRLSDLNLTFEDIQLPSLHATASNGDGHVATETELDRAESADVELGKV